MALRTQQRPTQHTPFLNRAFGLLWSGQTISELGSHITGSGIPLIAILVLKSPSEQVGFLVALSGLPALLFSLPIGVWVDRLPHRLLMLLSDLARALLLLSLPLAALSGLLHITQLYIVTLLLGTLTICFETAYRAFLPQIITREQLIEGNSKLGTSSSLAEIGGPPLAGALIQFIGAPLAVLFDALSFLCSAFSIWLIRPREIQPVARDEAHESFWVAMQTGVRALLAHPVLRALALFATIRTFFGATYAALYSFYIVHDLSLSPTLLGVLIAAGGVGALLGSLITPRLAQRIGPRWALLCGTLLHAGLGLITPLAGGPAPLLIGLLALSQFLGDIGFEIYAINEISLRQQCAEPHVLGRVNAAMNFLVNGIGPVGALLAGLLSASIGTRLVLLCGSCGSLLITAWLVFALRKTK